MGKHKSAHKKNKRFHKRSSSSSSDSCKSKRHRKKLNINSCKTVISSKGDSNHNLKEKELSKKIIGPVKMPHPSVEEYETVGNVATCVASEVYGPALPPTVNNINQNKQKETYHCTINDNEGKVNNNSNDDDYDIIGPLPPLLDGSLHKVEVELNQRAEALRKMFNNKKEEKKEINTRENWMLELPEEKSVKLGLGPRKFKLHDSGDKKNRSLWTETPNNDSVVEKAKNDSDNADEFKRMSTLQRDIAMNELVKKCTKEEPEMSLLDIHRKNRENKKNTESKERRPFDRDTDLHVNRFDETQKKSIIKKAQLLDSRFSQGQSKYL